MSLLRKTYYGVKPYLPQAVRTILRRRLAGRLLPKVGEVWPILPRAALKPSPWPGWPDGKRFAFVLTHDVERRGGMAKMPALADLEESHGFVSCVNFVPKGDYEVSREVRVSLERRGFEVGVHDLRHDGKLYSSRNAFRASAKQINAVLSDWGAVGFRSGFMHHNLEWLQDLKVEYDMSTFDTDPFEPQPDGVDTIFPFWVARPGGSGFVELPYTLPQDSTLFLCLQQKDASIWEKKLDWIADHGGMALLNVHPDYLNFENRWSSQEFPVRLYSEFLTHVRQRYGSEYWAALPREVARYCRDFQPIRPHTQVAAATEKVGVPELVRDPVVARNSLAKAG